MATANGNEKEALDFNLKAVAVDQRIVDLDPNNTSNKNELAIQTGNAGSSMMKLGDTAGALEKFRQALAIYESMIAADGWGSLPDSSLTFSLSRSFIRCHVPSSRQVRK